MPTVVAMTSKALRKRHRAAYERFFVEHETVISCAMSYVLLQTIGWRIGGPLVAQKLPWKAYIGVHRHGAAGTVTVGDARAYASDRDAFDAAGYAFLDWSAALPWLRAYAARRFGRADFPGIELTFLLEKPEHLAFDASIAMLATYAVAYASGYLQPGELDQIPDLTAAEIGTPTTPLGQKYRELHADATECMAASFSPATSGSTVFTNEIRSTTPLVHCTEERRGTIGQPVAGFELENVAGDPARIHAMRWWGFRLSELAGVDAEFPLDVMSISLGAGQEPLPFYAHVEEELIPNFERLQRDTKALFASIGRGNQRLPPFLQGMSGSREFWHRYLAGQTTIGLEFLRRLVALYRRPHAPEVAERFLEAVDASRSLELPFLPPPSKRMERVVAIIRGIADDLEVSVGLRVLSEDRRDAHVLVYSRPHTFRTVVRRVLAEVHRKVDRSAHVDFASWRDGWGSDGVQVEQDLAHGRYSEFVSPRAHVLRIVHPSEHAQRLVVTPDTSRSRSVDLLLDHRSGHVLVHGTPCTSRDLPSQKAAIELLAFLLLHIGEPVPNAELPAKTYTKYRNELQGKILSPLDKLLRRRCRKSLGVAVHGKLTDFTVTWNPGKLRIGILERASAPEGSDPVAERA